MKILVIRFKYIGDVMMTSVICNTLKKSIPNSEIHYVVHDISACLFHNDPSIDRVIGITSRQRKNPFAYLNFLRQCAKERYDIIIDANSTAKSELISLVSPNASFKIGRKKEARGFFYTHTIDEKTSNGHKIKQRLNMLKPLEDAGINIEWDNMMHMALNYNEKITAKRTLQQSGRNHEKPIIAMSVSSRESQKQWRRDYMLTVAKHCLNSLNSQVLLYAGAAHEQQDIQRFHQELNHHPDVISNIHTENLRELSALLSQCDMFIGNECGPRHIAQALNIPSVAIFSPSAQKSTWLPSESDRYQGIEWQDVKRPQQDSELNFDYGDSQYFKLYNQIHPNDVIPRVNEVFEKHVRHATRVADYPYTEPMNAHNTINEANVSIRPI